MKGWQATLALVGGLVLGIGLWFGFMWLGTPPAPPREDVSGAVPPAGPDLEASAAAPEDPPVASGISQATAPSGMDGAPHAFTIAQHTDELAALLSSAPSVSHGAKGPILYVVAFRNCPACIVIWRREVAGLDQAAIDLRWILYARRDKDGETRSTAQERLMVAELAHRPDPALLDAWFGDHQTQPPQRDKAPDEAATIESGRALVDRLNDIVTANGHPFAVPALFWREGEAWRGYIGYDAMTFAEVRAGLGAATAEAASGAQRP